MKKFDKQYKLIMENLGAEASTYMGVYDLYMNIVLDEVQIYIKKVFPEAYIEIQYEKTYTALFWQIPNTDKSIHVYINENGDLNIVAYKNDQELFKNNTLVLNSISTITDGTFTTELVKVFERLSKYL